MPCGDDTLSGVYEIVCLTTGQKYIGSTRAGFPKRWKQHQNTLNAQRHANRNLQAAWQTHGSDVFEFHILEVCLPKLAKRREQVHIDALRGSGTLYNIIKNVCSKRKLHPPSPEKNIDAWLRFKKIPSLIGGLNMALWLRNHGVPQVGGRVCIDTMNQALWALYRAGTSPIAWGVQSQKLYENTKTKTPDEFMAELSWKVQYYDREAERHEPVAYALMRAVGKVFGTQKHALLQMCRIVARSGHLYGDVGQRLDWESIAEIVGVDEGCASTWQQKMVDSGMLIRSGKKNAFRYTLSIERPARLSKKHPEHSPE